MLRTMDANRRCGVFPPPFTILLAIAELKANVDVRSNYAPFERHLHGGFDVDATSFDAGDVCRLQAKTLASAASPVNWRPAQVWNL